MKNFFKLTEVILSFKFIAVERDGKRYYEIDNPIEDSVWHDELTELRRKAIIELISAGRDISISQVKRLRNIHSDLDTCLNCVQIEEDRFAQFEAACWTHNITIHRQGELSGEVTISTSFISNLQTELWARGFMIEQLEKALQNVFFNAPIRIDSPFENIDYLADHNQIGREERGLTFYGFLNDKGKQIINNLVQHYSNSSPQVLFSMLFALLQLNMIDSSKRNFRKLKLKELAGVISSTFGRKLSPQTTTYNLSKFETPTPEIERLISKEMEIISAF